MAKQDALSVLQICSASEAIYGAALSVLTLANAQRRVGDRVEFVTFKGKRFGKQVSGEMYRVHEVRVLTKIDLPAVMRMRRLIRKGRFDIVHTHLSTSSVNGCLAAKFARVPSVATVHGMSGKLSFVFADHLIAVSQNVKSHLIDQGVPAGKISVVYNGLNLPKSYPDMLDARRTYELSGSPVVGTVARVTSQKGIEYGIEAIARLMDEFPHIRYVIAGAGDGIESCRERARLLGVERHVTFLGYQKDIPSVLSTMDLFLFPSLKEAMGIALVEAMAARLPIVSTTVDGIPEVVSPECGILVPPRSSEALAEATRGLLRNDLKRLAMGEFAQKRAIEVFGTDAMVGGVREVYRGMLQRFGSRRLVKTDESTTKSSAPTVH